MTRIGDTYRWIRGRVYDRPTNFSWVIEGKLAGCGLPVTEGEFKWVTEQGIKSIVTVREVPLPPEWFDGGDDDDDDDDVGYLHLKVEDFGAPTIEELDEAVDFIDQQIRSGKPVMVHCAAGKGRTGSVLAAYLVKKQGMTAEEAIEKIRSMRPGSIQSVVQETAVSMYEKYLKSNN